VTPAPVRRSWIGAIGLNGRPKSVRLLTVIVVLAALVVAVLAPLISIANHPARPLPAAAGVVLAAGLAAAGQLGRLRFRLGRGTVSVSWSEAALIVGLALAPPGWMPAATLIGAAVAWALLGVLHDRRGIAEVANLAASLSLGSAAGAGVTVLAARNADWSTPRMQAALVGGAAVSLLVAFGLATVTLLAYRDAEVRQIVTRVPAVKIPMFAGNLLVGLGAVFALVHEPRWLLAFPVALWMLQRSYRFHLRAEEERRTWEAFAAATATLPARRIGDVVDAGLRGALDVFGASRAEVEVNGVDGPLRSAQDGPGRDDTANVLAGPAITRTMTVGGEVVGELTVWLAEPTLPAPRDESAISAYADALAAALHDAAAHEHVARLQRLVEDDTLHDRLTGLTNRSTLIGNGDRLLRSFDRERQVALLLLDINDFREVNGTLGHRSGDDVLRIVSQRMRELARENELVARTGDDEFALFIPQFTTLTDSAATRAAPNALPQAMRRAREIVERLSLPMHVTGVRLAVEVAVGVAVATAGRGDLAELVRRASLALDQAKRHEVAVATHDAGQDALTTDELALLAELQDALAADDQILMHLQPAVDLVTAGPTGVEALVRWRHPRRGQLSPGDFIRTVEHTELLTPFTRRVLDLALNAAAAWGAAGIDVPVSVNVAARSLLDREFRLPAGPGDHRVGGGQRAGRGRRSPGRPAPQRCAALVGRLRHRVLLSVHSYARTGRRDQDRQVLRGRHDRRSGGGSRGARRRRARRTPRRTRGRRRRGDHRAARGPDRDGLPVGAGLPLLQAPARRPHRGRPDPAQRGRPDPAAQPARRRRVVTSPARRPLLGDSARRSWVIRPPDVL
jgi:diguanylate cyclase (GGDEF)-like protein